MLETLRINKGISKTFVADKLGISRDRLSRIEHCKVPLPAEFVPVLAELYGLSNDELVKERVKECQKQKKN